MKTAKKLIALVLSVLFVLTMAIPAFADEKQTLSKINLIITQPRPGEAPEKVIDLEEQGKYTAKISYWINQSASNSDPAKYKFDAFEAGNSYTVVFEVYPAEGYKFEATHKTEVSQESSTIVYVNGKETRSVAWEEENKLVRAFDFGELTEDNTGENSNFFANIIAAIRNFFAGIIDFFKGLFK